MAKPESSSDRLEFGNGFKAKLIDALELADEDEVEFHFRPSDFLVYMYRIPDTAFDKKHDYIVKRYKKEFCVLMSSSPGNISWLLLCDYEGKPTKLFERIDQQVLKERDFYKKECKVTKRLLSRALVMTEQLGKHNESQKRAWLKEAKEIAKIVSPFTGTTNTEEQAVQGETDYNE